MRRKAILPAAAVLIGLLTACAVPLLSPDQRKEICQVVVLEKFGSPVFEPNILSNPAGGLTGAGLGALAGAGVFLPPTSILIIFTVMLTRRVMADTGPTHNRTWWVALLSSVILLAGLLALVWQLPAFRAAAPDLTAADRRLTDLGTSLVDVNRYLLPFEVASVLLLAALIGALAVARPAAKGEEAEE